METIRVTVDGTDHDIAFDLCTAVDAKECRQQTGMSLSAVLGAVSESPDLDSVAVLVWLAHRQQGRKIPFEVVAKDITYGSKFEVTTIETVPDSGE